MRLGFRNNNKASHSDGLTSILSTSVLCPVLDSLINLGELDRFQGSIRTLVLELDQQSEINLSKLHILLMMNLRKVEVFYPKAHT